MRSLSDKAGFLITANLIKYSIGFILPMVLVRMLSQADYGTYQQLVLVSTTAASILTLGVPTSVYYFYHHVPEEQRATLIMQTTLLLVAGGVVAGLVVFFGSPFIAARLSNPGAAGLLAVSTIGIAFGIASEHCMAFVISQGRFQLAVVFETLEVLGRLLLVLAPLLLGFGIEGVVIGLVIFSVCRFAGRNGYLFLRSGVRYRGWSKRLFLGEQLQYSMPVALVSVSGIIGNTFNKGIIAVSFSPAQYAVYAVGNFPIPLSTIFQASVADVLRATLPPLIRDGNFAEVTRLVREASRKLAMIVLPSFLFLFGFAEQIITVFFTNKYRDSVDIFRIFVLSVPLDMLILSAIPQVFGRTRVNFYVNVASMTMLVMLSYVLLKLIGFYGAVVAATVSQYFSSTVFVIVAVKLTRSSLRTLFAWSHMLRVFLCGCVALAVAHLAVGWMRSGLLDLAVCGVIYSITWLALAFVTRVITSDDRVLMRRWVGRFLPLAAR